MNIKEKLLKQLAQSEKIANASKLIRLLQNPVKYILAIGHKKLIYSKNKEGILKETNTFFDKKMMVMLPAGTDIYLTGAKSHISEIRLARYLIHQLNNGDTFLDVGAHFGYFTSLASTLVGKEGRVFSIEASKNTFKVLKKNIAKVENIKCFQMAIADKNEPLKFYEFPILFSEYNSTEVNQYIHEPWYQKNKPTKFLVECITLVDFINNHGIQPKIIKIDVEGAEHKVIDGGMEYFKNNVPIIIMEYLEPKRYNVSHRKATETLRQLGYKTMLIQKNGNLKPCEDIEAYLEEFQLESDNVVFVKA
jgi:FkbM family methyltransferase